MDAAPAGPSLRTRFAVAIALTVAFYALALAVGIGMIALPIYLWVVEEAGNVWLTIFLVATGFTILRAIVPRRLHFEAPGPRVEPGEQPKLTELVSSVASEAGEDPPDDTYMTLEANAAVTEVRGRRVMIVGLPVMRMLSVDELRAVIAHEFGHYAGGDTRVGPWTYRTRETIIRTVQELHDEDSWGRRAVQQPFIWYAKAFLRITNAISRREEFAADAFAARVAGRDVHMSALRKIHELAPAYDAYWGDEVAPVLESGRRPPVGSGFTRFLSTEQVAKAVKENLERVMAEEKSDPYSSHPTLAERLTAAEALPETSAPGDSAPAVTLMDDIDGAERQVLDALAEAADAPALEPIDWDAVGESVYRERYHEMVSANGELLGDVTLTGLADAARDPDPLLSGMELTSDERAEARPMVRATLGAGLATALARQGFEVEAPVGEPIACRRGEDRLEPFELINQMADGKLDRAEWASTVERLGLEDVRLADASSEPAPEPAAAG
jgi:Zn-dependent protease with chaperone function